MAEGSGPGTTRRSRARAVREPQAAYAGRPTVWRAGDSAHGDTALLLDTHVWLWMLDGTHGTMSAAVQPLLERAARSQRLYVSDFSFWEVAMLANQGRLDLQVDLWHFLDRALEAPGVHAVPVTRDVLIASTRLPGTPQGDPADRILIAQAQAIGGALVTCDRGIIAYAKATPGVPVCDARR